MLCKHSSRCFAWLRLINSTSSLAIASFQRLIKAFSSKISIPSPFRVIGSHSQQDSFCLCHSKQLYNFANE